MAVTLALPYTSVLSFPTGELAGRSTAGTGALEALTLGTGLSISGGVLQLGSLTINTGAGLSGGGSVSIGGTLNLSNSGATSVSNSDSTLTISPTTGAVVASLNLAHANSWTGQQTFDAGTITTSQPLSITQTWNAGGVNFTGLRLNVTNTASAAGSLLMDLQVGGVSAFQVSPSISNSLFSGRGAIVPQGSGLVIQNSNNTNLIGAIYGSGGSLVIAGPGAPGSTVLTIGGGGAFSFNSSIVSSINNIATTSTDGVVLSNSTAATVSVQQQYSPRQHFISHGWNTTVTAADNYVEFINELRPQAGLSPTGNLVWSSRISTNGSGSFTDVMTLTSGGQLSVTNFSVATTATFNTTTFLGTNSFQVNSSDGNLKSWNGAVIGWVSINSVPGTLDTGFSRLTGNSVALGNGSANDFSGALKLTTLTVLAGSIVTDTTTGLKIGTAGGAAGQKLAFFNSTPIVQPLLATAAGHTADDIITTLQNLGLVRQS